MTNPLQILEKAKTVAVVGCSATPGKDAHDIPKFVAEHYTLHPVNPSASEIFGLKAYAKLADVPGPIDIVNVFRPSAETPLIAQQAVDVGAKALWLQTGIAHPEARRVAESARLDYVEDTCIRVLLRRHLAMRESKRSSG
jgi:predicted CoA-binding protein